MGLIKCDKCGYDYADSYKSCPFCQEDEERFKRKKSHRAKPGQRLEGHKKGPKIVGPVLIVVLVAVAAIVAYAFFGDSITNALRRGEDEPVTPVETAVTVTPASARLGEGEKLTLSADGAQQYLWSSDNERIATVDENGNVTAVASGTVTITVKDAATDASAQCVVTVTSAQTSPLDHPQGGEDSNSGESEQPVQISEKLKLRTIFGDVAQREDGKFDLTMNPTQSFALQVTGGTGTVSWSSSNTAVVTVDSDGTLHPVKVGEAEVIARIGGESAVCIVRVGW